MIKAIIFDLDKLLYQNSLSNIIIQNSFSRLGTIFNLYEVILHSRMPSWISLYNNFFLNNNLLIGCGYGCLNNSSDTIINLGLGADNLYLYLLNEKGIVGFVLFFVAIFSVYRNINKKYKYIFISFFFSFLIWGFTTEIFFISSGGIMFWLISGILTKSSIKEV